MGSHMLGTHWSFWWGTGFLLAVVGAVVCAHSAHFISSLISAVQKKNIKNLSQAFCFAPYAWCVFVVFSGTRGREGSSNTVMNDLNVPAAIYHGFFYYLSNAFSNGLLLRNVLASLPIAKGESSLYLISPYTFWLQFYRDIVHSIVDSTYSDIKPPHKFDVDLHFMHTRHSLTINQCSFPKSPHF